MWQRLCSNKGHKCKPTPCISIWTRRPQEEETLLPVEEWVERVVVTHPGALVPCVQLLSPGRLVYSKATQCWHKCVCVVTEAEPSPTRRTHIEPAKTNFSHVCFKLMASKKPVSTAAEGSTWLILGGAVRHYGSIVKTGLGGKRFKKMGFEREEWHVCVCVCV